MDIKQKLKKDKLIWNQNQEMDIAEFGRCLWQDKMEEFIGENSIKHQIIFLVNGLSSTLVDDLDSNHPLKKNKVRDLYSVIPTTELNTAISFYYGVSPSEHGVLGEYQHDKEANVSYCYTTFSDRIDERHLSIYGFTPKKVYQFPKIDKCKKRKYYTFVPNSILMNDSYQAILNDFHVVSYHGLADIPKKLKRLGLTSIKATTTVIYITELETMMRHGAKKDKISEWLDQFTQMAEKLKQKNNIVMISSLHGTTKIDASIVLNYVKYNKYFYALPSIEKRMTSFYVKAEYEEEFVREFKKDYGHLLGLYKMEELITLGIFGSGTHLENYGEYISVNLDHNYLELPMNEDTYMEQLNNPEYMNSCSGGMSKEEIIVPLILLEKS